MKTFLLTAAALSVGLLATRPVIAGVPAPIVPGMPAIPAGQVAIGTPAQGVPADEFAGTWTGEMTWTLQQPERRPATLVITRTPDGRYRAEWTSNGTMQSDSGALDAKLEERFVGETVDATAPELRGTKFLNLRGETKTLSIPSKNYSVNVYPEAMSIGILDGRAMVAVFIPGRDAEQLTYVRSGATVPGAIPAVPTPATVPAVPAMPRMPVVPVVTPAVPGFPPAAPPVASAASFAGTWEATMTETTPDGTPISYRVKVVVQETAEGNVIAVAQAQVPYPTASGPVEVQVVEIFEGRVQGDRLTLQGKRKVMSVPSQGTQQEMGALDSAELAIVGGRLVGRSTNSESGTIEVSYQRTAGGPNAPVQGPAVPSPFGN